MRKLLPAVICISLFAVGFGCGLAIAQDLFALPNWTTSTRFGDAPGVLGFNTTTNLPEWLDNNATWHSFTPTDSPTFTGTLTAAAVKATSEVVATTIQQTTAYNAATKALPTCNTAAEGTQAWVSDATGPTYLATYVSGGAVIAPVFCNGTTWLTY